MLKFDEWYENNIKNKLIDIFKIDIHKAMNIMLYLEQ